MNDEIKGYECKHAVYLESTLNYQDDMLAVKENVHYKDGRVVPTMRLIKNFKRPFWVTRAGNRDHNDKKESEELRKVQEFTCTQRGLLRSVEKALGRVFDGGMRTASLSPYLYGCDITTPVLIKQKYMEKFPDLLTDNVVAVLDIESDVVLGHERPIIVSLTCRDKAIITVDKAFLAGVPNAVDAIHAAFDQHLGEFKRSRGIELEVVLVDRISEGICKVLERAHEWKPDFVAIWNINYDIPKILSVLERDKINPADVFSDPSIPLEFRYFNYKEGPAKKVTASGKEMTLSPAERWHVLTAPASFIFMDAMCVYQKIRIAKGKEPSYALDDILKKVLGLRKLNIKEGEGLTKMAWHMFMQRHHPVFYCIYNLWDDISVELLDEKTTDLRRTVSLLCGFSEYSRFSSQPKRTCDDLFFFYQKHGHVAATTSRKMRDKLDDDTIGLQDWIVTLPSYMVDDVGLKLIEECPNQATSVYAQVADLDVSATYPTEEVIFNVGKATTKRELCAIQGVSEQQRRMQGVNLTGGHTNAVQICVAWYKAPSFSQMLEAFENSLGLPSVAHPQVIELPEVKTAPATVFERLVAEVHHETAEGINHLASDVVALL